MKFRAVPAVYVCLAWCSTVWAWGSDGHQIVAAIAATYLTPEAQAGVRDLLGKKSLPEVATWADAVRKKPEYLWSDSQHGARVADGADQFKLDRDCRSGCAPSGIIRLTKVLQDPSADRKSRVEALKFLVHFAGDLHQPLHVVSKRQKESGSNVRFFGEPVKSLHYVWDAALIQHTGKEWRAYAKELRGKITPRQFAEWTRSTDPAQWATESFRASVRAYELPSDRNLDRPYFERSIPVVDQRLSMAGVRLAARLNAIFTPHPTSSASSD